MPTRTFSTYDINPGPVSSTTSNITPLDDSIYFVATDATNGSELRKLNTNTGVISTYDLYPGLGGTLPNSSRPTILVAENGKVYLRRRMHVWTRATRVGSREWIDSNRRHLYWRCSSNVAYYGDFKKVGDTFRFIATDSVNGYQFRSLDIATLAVNPIVEVTASRDSGYPNNIVSVGDDVYFSGYDEVYGHELQKLNQSTGVVTTIDINPGGAWSSPGLGGIVLVGTKLVFSAADSLGQEVRILDTADDSITTIDINSGAASSNPGHFSTFTVLGDKVFFSANDPVNGIELRVLDTSDNSLTTMNLAAGWQALMQAEIPISFKLAITFTLARTIRFTAMNFGH